MSAASSYPRNPLTAPLKPPQPPSSTAGQLQPKCSRFGGKASICQSLCGIEWRVHLSDWWEINFKHERGMKINLCCGQETPLLPWALGADSADSPKRKVDNTVHNQRLQGLAGIYSPTLLIQQSWLPGRWCWEGPGLPPVLLLPTAAAPLWGGERLSEATWHCFRSGKMA